MGEPSEERVLPSEGSLPALPLQVSHIRPAPFAAGLIWRLLNTDDEDQTATIGSGLFRIQAAWACDLFEKREETFDVANGGMSMTILPRRFAVIALHGAIPDGV